MATHGLNRKCTFFTEEQRKQHAEEPEPHYHHNVRLHLGKCLECQRFFATYRAAKGLRPIDFKRGTVLKESRA